MKRTIVAAACASLLGLTGAVSADSVVLSEAQMDGVTAGATAIFEFATGAAGDWGTQSLAVVQAIAVAPGLASVALAAGSLANSVLGPAQSVTVGTIASSLP